MKIRESGGVGSDMAVTMDGFSGKHVKVFIDGVPQEGVGNSFGINNIPVTKYADSVPVDKLRGWIYSIHTDSLGGMITRVLWLIGALLGASLPLTGYYIWIKHLMHPKKSKGLES